MAAGIITGKPSRLVRIPQLTAWSMCSSQNFSLESSWPGPDGTAQGLSRTMQGQSQHEKILRFWPFPRPRISPDRSFGKLDEPESAQDFLLTHHFFGFEVGLGFKELT